MKLSLLGLLALFPLPGASDVPAQVPVAAQEVVERLQAHLSVVPVDFQTIGTTSGTGDVAATVEDGQLVLEGTFQGLHSPATAAEIRQGPPGIPGPEVAPLEVSGDASGSLRGSLELTRSTAAAARAGHLYVLVRTEGNPDGEIRGWLLPPGWDGRSAP